MTGRTVALAALGLGAAALVGRRGAPWRWRDRVVFITGGSRGLGLVLARELVAREAVVVICARDPAELLRAEAELRARGGLVLAIRCDVTYKSQLETAIRETHRRAGRIDALINNAGIIQIGPLGRMTPGDFERALAVHFWAPLHAALSVAPIMRRQGGGRVVNIVSIGGRVALPHMTPYVASKFAAAGLSRALRLELARDRVRVTTVFPGLMRTGSTVQARVKGSHEREFAWFGALASLPLLTLGARRAALQILQATARGRAEVVLGMPARLLAHLHDLAPGLTYAALASVARRMPDDPGRDTGESSGRASDALPAWLTWLSDRAAARNNELSPLQGELA